MEQTPAAKVSSEQAGEAEEASLLENIASTIDAFEKGYSDQDVKKADFAHLINTMNTKHFRSAQIDVNDDHAKHLLAQAQIARDKFLTSKKAKKTGSELYDEPVLILHNLVKEYREVLTATEKRLVKTPDHADHQEVLAHH